MNPKKDIHEPDELDKEEIQYEYLDGKTKNRQEKVSNFQNDGETSPR